MVRQTPSILKALGRRPLPETIALSDGSYRLIHVFKHDFFAATALYDGAENGRVVLKLGRQADVFGLPSEWIGRLLVQREIRAYERLGHLPGIPRFRGRWGRCGLVHDFVPGRPLKRGHPVPDDFFSRLATLLNHLHEAGMAYVDLEKPENVLLGDEGDPYLFDFQISWYWPWKRGGGSRLARWIARRLQRGDLYHLRKLQRRIRPDQLSAEELAASYQTTASVKLHRTLFRPLTRLRRAVLQWIDPRRAPGERGRVDSPSAKAEP